MSETETAPESTPFWRFSLHFYRQAGVADACIALQDDCGVDVNVLMFLLWLAANRQCLADAAVKAIDDKVRDWRNLTIVPIRDVRRRLKEAATLIEKGRQEAYRTRVKAVELEAERLQQEALYAFARSGPLGTPAEPGAAARANIAAYERLMAVSFPKPAADILIGAFDGIEHRGFSAR